MPSHAVGIDLGTTYSAVARIDENGRSVMLRSVEGELLTPSVVLFDQDETIVGRDAKKARAVSAGSVAECAKRDMGSPVYSKLINGQQLPPEVIQACILRKLRGDVVAQLGEGFKCVVTVPAYFDEPRRKATSDAGEMAGLDVLNIVNEPTAAALAFGEQLGYLAETGAPAQHMRVLVYDLGGGTFDVTVIELKPGEIVTLATDGDVQLGGYDWDERLLNYVAEQFQQQCGFDLRTDEALLGKVRGEVEEAKHTLTARDKSMVRIEHLGRTMEVPITRDKFRELTEDLLERTAYTTRQVIASVGLSWNEISRILLVGGSSRMPMVTDMLEKLSGLRPDRSVNPDEAVARGAAIFADYLLSEQGDNVRGRKFSVTDVNSHSLGIEGINQKTMRKENVILIPRNTPLPRQIIRKFSTKEDNQKTVVVQVLEGESSFPEQCTPIGRAVIRNLPFGLPQGTRIEVVYRYNTNGRLAVRARLPGTGNEASIELERDQAMTMAGMTRWREVITGEGGFAAYQQALSDIRNPPAPSASKTATDSWKGQAVSQPAAASGPAAIAPQSPATQSPATQFPATLPPATQPAMPLSPLASNPTATQSLASELLATQPLSAQQQPGLPMDLPTSPPSARGWSNPQPRSVKLQPSAVPLSPLAELQAANGAGLTATSPALPTPAMPTPTAGSLPGTSVAQPLPGSVPPLPGLTPIKPSVKPLPKVSAGGLQPAASPLGGSPPAVDEAMPGPMGSGAARLRPTFANQGATLPQESSDQDEEPNLIGQTLAAIRQGIGRLNSGGYLGFALAVTLGMTVGYYVLCLIRPEANFLGLPLPGVKAPAQTPAPAAPSGDKSTPAPPAKP